MNKSYVIKNSDDSKFSAKLDPQDKKYLEYLKLKAEILKKNLENLNTLNYRPQDVLFDETLGAVVIPRPNPLQRVYEPENPSSDRYGMIYLPNVNQQQETLSLKNVEGLISRYSLR